MKTLEILLQIWFITLLFSLPGFWFLFKKLGLTPWKGIIPILNFIVLMQFFNLSLWYLLLILIPYGLIVLEFLIGYRLSKSFGYNVGFALGFAFWISKPIFITFLGYGKSEFIGTEGLV